MNAGSGSGQDPDPASAADGGGSQDAGTQGDPDGGEAGPARRPSRTREPVPAPWISLKGAGPRRLQVSVEIPRERGRRNPRIVTKGRGAIAPGRQRGGLPNLGDPELTLCFVPTLEPAAIRTNF